MANKFPPAKILINRAVEIGSLRHERERTLRSLSISAGVLTAGVLVALAAYNLWIGAGILTAAVLSTLIVAIVNRLIIARMHGNAAQVSEQNLPELEYIKNVIARSLDDQVPFTILVVPAELPEPCWRRFGTTWVLLISDRIVRATIERDQIGQLTWLIGRMMGLRLTQRGRWRLADWLIRVARFNPLTTLLVHRYFRVTHFSADRIGLSLNHSLIEAAEIFRMHVSRFGLHTRLNLDELGRESRFGRTPRLWRFLEESLRAQPSLNHRYHDLVAFCRDKHPDLYADFEFYRKYQQEILPSYRRIQEFSEAKEEENRILRELGNIVYDKMSPAPPLNDADAVSSAFLHLHRNRGEADDLETKMARLLKMRDDWLGIVEKIQVAEEKREAATLALEGHYKELGRTAFDCLQPEVEKEDRLRQVFEKALQYRLVIRDRQQSLAQLESTAASLLDKSKHTMEMMALKNQNSHDEKRMLAAAEAAGEVFWKHCADRYERDELEPIRLRISGVVAELERRAVELTNLYGHKRQLEHDLDEEGLESVAQPDIDIPVMVDKLKTQARAASVMRPRLLEKLGKSYWQNETNYMAESLMVVERLNDLRTRISEFERDLQ